MSAYYPYKGAKTLSRVRSHGERICLLAGAPFSERMAVLSQHGYSLPNQ